MIRVTVWNENYHEKTSADVRAVHPKGLHETLGMIFKEIPEVTVTEEQRLEQNTEEEM